LLLFICFRLDGCERKTKKARDKRDTQVSTAPKCLTCFPLSTEMMGGNKRPRASCVLRERTARTSTGDWSLFQVTRCLTYI
jgi:hypothetical protein